MRPTVQAVVLLLALIAGCGDGTFILITNLGVVSANASCSSQGGQFPLLNAQGLTILVIITDETSIVAANGSFTSCPALRQGTQVSVKGSQDHDHVTAKQIHILGP